MNKKIFLTIFLIVLQFTIIGCKSNIKQIDKTAGNDMKAYEKNELIESLQKEKKDLTIKNSLLEAELKSDSDEQTKKINQLQKELNTGGDLKKKNVFLENELSYCYLLKDIYINNNANIFHPALLAIGDKVANLTVSNIEIKDFSRKVIFNGEFQVELKVYKDSNREYVFEVTDDYNDKVAKDIFTYSKNYHMKYSLGSSTDELLKSINDKYYEGIKVTVILNNYSISYDMSDYLNNANFIKLISLH